MYAAAGGNEGNYVVITIVTSSLSLPYTPPTGSLHPTAIVTHCELTAPWHIAKDAYVVGVRNAKGLRLASGLGLQQVAVRPPQGPAPGSPAAAACIACFLFGTRDRFFLPAGHRDATFLNRPWSEFLTQIGNPELIWPDRPKGSERCLWHARLFPVDPTTWDATAAAECIEWMQDPWAEVLSVTIAAWRGMDRWSMGEILAMAQESLALEDEWR